VSNRTFIIHHTVAGQYFSGYDADGDATWVDHPSGALLFQSSGRGRLTANALGADCDVIELVGLRTELKIGPQNWALKATARKEVEE
jgi:hypothetical protein